MDRNELKEKVRNILSEEFEIETGAMTEDAPLMLTLELDSLDVVDMVVLVEKNFGFKMKTSDFAAIKTFDDLYDVIEAGGVK